MKIETVCILRDEDLLFPSIYKLFVDINEFDFKDFPRKPLSVPMYIYINSNGRTKIIKNRWGKTSDEDRWQISFKVKSKVNKFLQKFGFKPKETDYCIMFDQKGFTSIMSSAESNPNFDIEIKKVF